jgi:hypothetical protein
MGSSTTTSTTRTARDAGERYDEYNEPWYEIRVNVTFDAAVDPDILSYLV